MRKHRMDHSAYKATLPDIKLKNVRTGTATQRLCPQTYVPTSEKHKKEATYACNPLHPMPYNRENVPEKHNKKQKS